VKKRKIFDDPIVAEVRRHRQAIAAKFGYDIRAIAEDARKREATSGHPIANLEQEAQGKRRSAPAAGAPKRATRKLRSAG
jgi:hypothetical protein